MLFQLRLILSGHFRSPVLGTCQVPDERGAIQVLLDRLIALIESAGFKACQARCRLSHAAECLLSVLGFEAPRVAARVSSSGFSVTRPMDVQLRVGPLQRRGCLA